MMSGSASVENALRCLGRGFDVSCDFRLKYCKGKVAAASDEKAELIVPGFGAFRDVPVDVKCDKGDRIRFRSDVLEFNKMSELFNQRSSLSGKIPSGLFNSMFLFDGSSWAQDAAKTKCLALDGYFISLFNLRLDSQPLALSSHIVDAVPSTWDPAAIASFIENYGTHIIVGLSMGGKDVVYVKQENSSHLTPCEIKEHLDKLGDQLFTGTCTLPPLPWKSKEHKNKAPEAFNVFDTQPKLEGLCPVTCKEGVTVICSKRGGDASVSSHSEWLLTVPKLPDVINFTFVPITSLLKGVPGTGFLSHAINLYLRYKPPINELKYFLDFQHHKMWAPMHNDLPLGPSSNRSVPTPALQFTPMGPKLCVNTNQVIVKKWPVTGMRLHLEGKKNNRLAIHLQHLTCTPKFIKVQPDKPPLWRGSDDIADERYCEPVQWKMFAHVCTAPVKYDPNWLISGRGTAFIVTGAQLDIKVHESTNVLHLRLLYSEVPGCIVSQSKWVHSPSGFSEKMSFLSMSFPTSSSGLEKEKQQGPVFNLDSAVFPTGPPVPVGAQKMLKFVDTSHVATGPQDSPGYWLVTGAKLELDKGRIMLNVKFSLLISVS
ncbi:MACPF domain-containing protein At1g14780 isoform X2 [Ananas comosus]|uniref:MACPF domain-containing protein At1g14780 isoform X2 n=1 Tax=Ananas comosus TaxID=4615 RepID=A0A6P5F851_ANACO|nr:MACPF domain-containing protein At1g14780 isoform X2 [Ananas comosus]